MHNWRLGLSLAVILAGSGFLLSAQDDDLDSLTPQELAQDLEYELDDLFDELGLDEDEQYEDGYLFDEIMIALSDQGDDEQENEITLEELQEEMKEASTTLQAVVTSAVQSADQMSFREAPPSPRMVLARFYALSQKENRRGWAVAGVAKRQTATAVAGAIRKAR